MAEKRQSLGRITIIPSGDYDTHLTYNRLNLVTYSDPNYNNNKKGLYIAKKDDLKNVPPVKQNPNNANEYIVNQDYWMKLMDENDLAGPTGNGISSITGPTNPGQAGEADIYTINYTNGSSFTFQITNGQDGQNAISPNFDTPTTNTLSPGQQAYVNITPTGPANNNTYHLTFGIPKGETGAESENIVTWESITGNLSDNDTLQRALDAKVNSIDLGTMATVDDAPSNNKIYGRNNNSWVEIINNSGSSESDSISNPLTFIENNDKVEIGLFNSGDEANIEIRGTQGGNNPPAIEITQYNSSGSIINNNRRLTLLDTFGNTYIRGNLNLPNNPLSIENGGTGLNEAPSMLTNLGSTEADSPLASEPRPGVTGILPTGNGGTGVTGPGLQLLENLGVHVTSIDPGADTELETGHILLVYET